MRWLISPSASWLRVWRANSPSGPVTEASCDGRPPTPTCSIPIARIEWPEPGSDMRQPIDFRSPDFLCAHILDTMAFYEPVARDPSGGFFHFFKDDGTVYDRQTRHLVSSARFVFNQATAFRRFGKPQWQDDA